MECSKLQHMRDRGRDYGMLKILQATLQMQAVLLDTPERKGRKGRLQARGLISAAVKEPPWRHIRVTASPDQTDQSLCLQATALGLWVPPRWWCPGKCPVFMSCQFLYLFHVSLVVRL